MGVRGSPIEPKKKKTQQVGVKGRLEQWGLRRGAHINLLTSPLRGFRFHSSYVSHITPGFELFACCTVFLPVPPYYALRMSDYNAQILVAVNEHAKTGKGLRQIQEIIERSVQLGEGRIKEVPRDREGVGEGAEEMLSESAAPDQGDAFGSAVVAESHASRMASIFRAELEEIRRDDPDFIGTANQVALLREALTCDAHIMD